ncbi:M48 family metallopeptidase [Noviherbaspirillum malthae]|uniref:M48 family metallopeptidase n=1 Tax=Noviherbaspirillum malthae TaxID=1260987 RepID=UPI00188EDB10|nr:M48 family metallopeptidase [Noviherbaspirillum malthae]
MLANKLVSPQARVLLATMLAVSLGMLSGCVTTVKRLADLPAKGTVSSTEETSPVGALSPPTERAWPNATQDVLNQRARNFGLVNAPEMQRYLNGLYARLKTQAGVAGWPGTVHILATDALNAYATAAGNIYVSLPWLSSVESEDELVALLSHEFGHIYLHYHQLEGAVADANTAADAVSLGIAIAKNTAQATGWTQLDSFTTAYTLSRGLVTTIYSRSQESAADNFGLNLSLKLGYSYEHGMKAFLERMATWEERNEEREKARQQQLVKALRESSKNGVSAEINTTLQNMAFDLNKAFAKMRSDHPETQQRIDALALAVEPFPQVQTSREPIMAPLKSALQERRTTAILKNYALAFQAINAPWDPASAEAAKRAVTAPTANHAVPLFALYTVLNEHAVATGNRRVDPGQVLEANFNSEPDRSWKTYLERSSALKERHKTADAKKVMEAGLAYFRHAEEAWPDAVRFVGLTDGWNEAKRMAGDCGKNFRRMSSRCTQAAISPAERAKTEQLEKRKAEHIVDKIFKKK